MTLEVTELEVFKSVLTLIRHNNRFAVCTLGLLNEPETFKKQDEISEQKKLYVKLNLEEETRIGKKRYE